MNEIQEGNIRQYGDFQTPPELAASVCERLRFMGIAPSAIIEPTCGRGAFLKAAAETFPKVREIIGIDINPRHVADAREVATGNRVEVEQGDFFQTNWLRVLNRNAGPWLVLGNPPWVTNAEMGVLNGTNLPTKSNFQSHRGLDALTGRANFDISEWMLLQQVKWLGNRSGWIAMLAKTAVARKVLRRTWMEEVPTGRAAIFKVDAMRHFGAAVDACLFVLPVAIGRPSRECRIFSGVDDEVASDTIAWRDGMLVSDADAFAARRNLIGKGADHVWRSGVKHDCSRIMELSADADGNLTNGLGERVEIEDDHLFPMLKGSDVAKGRIRSRRFMILPQRSVGEKTDGMEAITPLTWAYLNAHGDRLDMRRSRIYQGKPRFSVFGVGRYTFMPWKVAISGFNKTIHFVRVGPIGGKPVVFDDTVYFLPCRTKVEADFILSLVRSEPFMELMRSMIFPDNKRPITAEVLRRISLERVANTLGMDRDYHSLEAGNS